jgi:DNA-binding transcriptional regulator YiaG
LNPGSEHQEKIWASQILLAIVVHTLYDTLMTGPELKKWRTARNLTQRELAELLHVATVTVQSWEQGVRKVPNFLYLALREIDRNRKGKR